MPTNTEELLNVEESVHNLLSNLERLKDEVQHYEDARQTLEQMGTKIQEASEALTRLSGQSAEVVQAIRDIGTPEILASIDRLRAQYADADNKTLAATGEILKQGTALSTTMSNGLAGVHQAVEQRVAKMQMVLLSVTVVGFLILAVLIWMTRG